MSCSIQPIKMYSTTHQHESQAKRSMATRKHASAKNDFPRPYTTVDVLIFTVIGDALKVLLVQRPSATDEPSPGLWALPGGFVDVDLDTDLEACARRKLRDKTGIDSPYLEQ